MRYIKFLFFSFILSFFFFLPSDVNAASVSCSGSVSNLEMRTSYSFISNCDFSSLDSSSDWFYNLSFSDSSLSPSSSVNSFFCFSVSSLDCYNAGLVSTSDVTVFLVPNSFWSVPSFSFSDSSSGRFSDFMFYPRSGFLSYSGSISYSVVVSDSFGGGSCPDSPSGSLSITSNGSYDVSQFAEVVVDVPPSVVSGDYHEDLISIKSGIYTCAAVLLVLYFFYCIYRLIIRTTGGV